MDSLPVNRRFYVPVDFRIAKKFQMISNTMNDSVVQDLSNCIHYLNYCYYDFVVLYAFPMMKNNYRRLVLKIVVAAQFRYLNCLQFQLKLVFQMNLVVATMIVYMHQLILHEMQLYDIVPIGKRRKKTEKLKIDSIKRTKKKKKFKFSTKIKKRKWGKSIGYLGAIAHYNILFQRMYLFITKKSYIRFLHL